MYVVFPNLLIAGGDTGLTYDPEFQSLTPRNLQVPGQSDLGIIDNVKIDGGLSGYVVSTDGYGNLFWGAGEGSSGFSG